jgi:hypothetical protein
MATCLSSQLPHQGCILDWTSPQGSVIGLVSLRFPQHTLLSAVYNGNSNGVTAPRNYPASGYSSTVECKSRSTCKHFSFYFYIMVDIPFDQSKLLFRAKTFCSSSVHQFCGREEDCFLVHRSYWPSLLYLSCASSVDPRDTLLASCLLS